MLEELRASERVSFPRNCRSDYVIYQQQQQPTTTTNWHSLAIKLGPYLCSCGRACTDRHNCFYVHVRPKNPSSSIIRALVGQRARALLAGNRLLVRDKSLAALAWQT